MVKKVKKEEKKKTICNKTQPKRSLKRKINKGKAHKKPISMKVEIKLNKIEKQIVSFVKKNNLNYYDDYYDKMKVNSLKQIIEKTKESCLCKISDEFGSAVCINEKGYLLTCSHVVDDNENEQNNETIYIFPNGEIVKAKTIEKNEKLDLALLKIIEIYQNKKFVNIEKLPDKKFNYSKIKSSFSNENEPIGSEVFCIGNPAFELYNEYSNKMEKNEYKPFWVSFGKIKGYLREKVYCTKDLGPLIHNCWTYWGHSGAPIFNYQGEIVGMHNSWNDKNADRHGNSLLGIIKFLADINLS